MMKTMIMVSLAAGEEMRTVVNSIAMLMVMAVTLGGLPMRVVEDDSGVGSETATCFKIIGWGMTC